MAETAKVLPFRAKREPLSQEGAASLVRDYLAVDMAERSGTLVEESLSNPDFLMALCASLRKDSDTEARRVASEAEATFRWIDASPDKIGLFDEADFFRGELALIAGGANRVLGHFDDAEVWIHRAESSFGLTVNPAPSLAAVTYARVSLLYDRQQYDQVKAIMPSVLRGFARLEMKREMIKCQFVLAMAHKQSGQRDECLKVLQAICNDPSSKDERDLHCLALVNVGELLLAEGRNAEAAKILSEGQSLLQGQGKSIAGAHLYGVLGETLSRQGQLGEAATAFRAAVAIYQELSMPGYVAYFRLALAENLLAAGDYRQAEWEVLAALPTIDEQRLESDARAAVALLLQSTKAKKTDVGALSRLRQHLKAAS
jgi:tetratricopeptide (TPR) repeat protein